MASTNFSFLEVNVTNQDTPSHQDIPLQNTRMEHPYIFFNLDKLDFAIRAIRWIEIRIIKRKLSLIVNWRTDNEIEYASDIIMV